MVSHCVLQLVIVVAIFKLFLMNWVYACDNDLS